MRMRKWFDHKPEKETQMGGKLQTSVPGRHHGGSQDSAERGFLQEPRGLFSQRTLPLQGLGTN